jgi:ATP-dependent DNA helicase RecG
MTESQQVEWKSSWRDDCLRWICGFANAEGGRLVIGRDDRGLAVGVKNARKLLEEIPNKVRDLLGIMVAVNLREEAGKDTVEIVVEPYPYPVSYKGEYHYRSGSTKQELKGAALDRFLLRKHGRTWDGVPLPGLALSDLEKGLKAFRKLARRSQRLPEMVLEEPDQDLLEKLHLLEGPYLTRAAALLFHPEPERFFTGAYVKIGYFESNADLRYHDEIQGDLITQVEQTIEVLKTKYLRAWITYDGLQRVETWPVPMPALREAVLNAVVHKDYASGGTIQISVYPDKLMIWNPGELPPDWTVERLLEKHASIPFNPDVAGVFFRAGMIESWGRGIERILETCRVAGTPTPELRHERSGLWTEFRYRPEHRLPVSPDVTGEVTARTPVETVGTPVETVGTPVETVGTPVETPVETVGTPVETPAKTADRVVELLRADPQMTLAEVAAGIGKSLRSVERAAANLVREGRIRHVGPRKGGHWEALE